MSNAIERSGPLKGMLILDFTTAVSGPLCGQLLYDNGSRAMPPDTWSALASFCNE